MEDEQLREFAAFDGDVAWIVVHGLRRVQPLQLAARRLRLEDQGGKLPGPGVDAGRQTGGGPPPGGGARDHWRPATNGGSFLNLFPPAGSGGGEITPVSLRLAYLLSLPGSVAN